jgi:SAM-dependent methyltransferase
MSWLRLIYRNIGTLLGDDLQKRWQEQDARSHEVVRHLEKADAGLSQLETRADTYETAVDARIAERLATIETRLDEYQTAIDGRIADRVKMLEQRLADYQTAVDDRIEERINAIEQRLDEYRGTLDTRIDERLSATEATLDTRFAEHQEKNDARADGFESALSDRATEYESHTASRLEAFETEAASRADTYESALDTRIDARLASLLKRVDEHFDARSLATDNRLDDRFARVERHIDTRFDILEKRSDDRMETHERTVDGRLHQRSQDIVDRNDLMLQIFDQQLDRFRRQLRSMDTKLGGRSSSAGGAADNGDGGADGTGAGNPLTESDVEGSEAPHELVSFRKLAGIGSQQLRKAATAATPLYHQILSWKKAAHEGLTDFAPDEQEIVDYVLSFLSDEKEIAYVRQHLRRFVATIERVPAPANPEDRLLELGSLGHLAPAISRFCGYREMFCGDYWEGDERVRNETLKQVDGPDAHAFELRNFNVEIDKFPYPDGFFKTILCCELIEHLQRDPLHMLWECNRVLADGGHILLTTPNITSVRAIEGLLVGCTPYLLSQYNLKEVSGQHNREYAPYEIGIALVASGFSVVALETEDVWLRSNPAVIELLKELEISVDLRGDNIFALARKVGPPIERYPAELYTDR